MIQSDDLRDACMEFESEESRGSFYDMAVNLLNKGFKIEAYLLLLATWNFASFRYAVKDFDLMAFENTINALETNFRRLDGQDIRTANLESLREDIAVIYSTLAQIKGIQYTGAAKMMHLRNRELFVMWDEYIRGAYPKKLYRQLDIVKRGDWTFKAYKTTADGYLTFLQDMQQKFTGVSFDQTDKTLAKAIDEFNYVNVTLQVQKAEKAAEHSRTAKTAPTATRTGEP
jgi:hypothetical protein